MATNLTVITGEGSTSYSVSAGARGPVGATGAQGAVGAVGATGAVGAVGATGAVGAVGATGAVGAVGATGATGAAGPNTITTATTTPLVGFLSGNGTTVTASLGATAATPDTLVLRGAQGQGTFGSETATALFAESDGVGAGAEIFSHSGIGASISSSTGDHINVGFGKLIVSQAGLIQIGGTSASFPALKRNGTGIDIRFADDSGAGTITASNLSGTNTGDQFTAVTSQRLIGRHAGGSGAAQEVQVGDGIEFQGSGIRRSALTGDVTASAGSNSTTLAATIAGDKTFSGDMSFTSTTRPTSGGTGTPAATSLITLADGDARFGQRIIKVAASDASRTPDDILFVADPVLTVELSVGTWQIECNVFFNNNDDVCGSRVRLAFSGTSDHTKSPVFVLRGTSSASAEMAYSSATRPVGALNAAMPRVVLIHATNRNALVHTIHTVAVSVAGTYRVDWGQGTASSTSPVIRKAGSTMIALKLS